MEFNDEILVNKFGQNLIEIEVLVRRFNLLKLKKKRLFLNNLVNLIIQSKANDSDVDCAILISGLKKTYTPCVMLRNGVAYHLLKRIIDLPENELEKSLVLLLTLFRIAYTRRFNLEKNNPDKWWYWDLSDEDRIKLI